MKLPRGLVNLALIATCAYLVSLIVLAIHLTSVTDMFPPDWGVVQAAESLSTDPATLGLVVMPVTGGLNAVVFWTPFIVTVTVWMLLTGRHQEPDI